MSQPLLIDTCVLKELVSSYEFSGYLNQINSWIDNKYINLIVPQTIEVEWTKHRIEEQKKIDRVIKNHQSDLKKSKLFLQTPEINEIQIEGANKLLLSQISTIDKLLDNGLKSEDEPALILMWNHQKEGKAPFHNKKESYNDAVIIFSALNAVKELNGNKLIVFSSNHTDLSDPIDRSKIHPDISSVFPDIEIVYFADKSTGIKYFIDNGLPSLLASKPREIDVKSYFPINPNLSSLDQLYSYLERRFKDINFLPKSLFSLHAPIVSSNSAPTRIIPFHLNTDNKDLFNLFENYKNLSLDHNELLKHDDFGHSFIKVCEHLRHNYVYGLILNDHGSVEVPNLEMQACNCQLCSIRKFKYNEAFEDTKIENIPKTLKSAFIYYLLGDFKNSISILKIVAEDSESQKNFISYYIANYNQHLLHRHLTYNFYIKNNELAESVKDIHLDEVLIKSKTESIEEILNLIDRGNFWKGMNSKFDQIANRIRNENLDNLSGWTDSLNLLIECYFEVVSLIEENFIMLDSFSEVFNLTSRFVEALFASYTSNTNLVSKLTELNDPILKKLIVYGKSDDFIKYRQRYNIQILSYAKSDNGESFSELFCNLLDSCIYFIKINPSKVNKEEYFLVSKLRKMVFNAITLSSMIELDKEDLNRISYRLISFLDVNEHKNSHDISKTISTFIRNNGQIINKEHLTKFLNYFIKSDINFDYTFIILTIKSLKISKSIKVSFSTSEWEEYKLKFSNKELFNQNTHFVDYFCSLYYFLNNPLQKAYLRKFANDLLSKSFSYDLYYNLTINKIIPTSEYFNIQYEKYIIERVLKGKKASVFPSNFYHDLVLDEYINFCLCFKLSFPIRLLASIELLGDYYQWLLNKKNIQDVNMHIDWLSVYPSIFYLKFFKNKPGLKIWLKNEIINSNDNKAGRIYAQLF
ncbi:PIN domain-containing protein [Sphingobacterium siyangense]|uniref:PIN domain-containing protein n=1 Tax=Sphingobacterium siyangense TaxID=459529 RepID=UPI002FDAA684